MLTDNYPTGSDLTVYLGRGTEPPAFTAENELDVTGITIVEEGGVVPLYDFTSELVRHFAYGTRMVTGSLAFNYSDAFAGRHRTGSLLRPSGIGSMRGDTLWILLRKIEWLPETSIVEEVVRMRHVWEHPFQHAPEPFAQETIPFTARELEIVERRRRRISRQGLEAFLSETGAAAVDGRDVIDAGDDMVLARVLAVDDGDTIVVRNERTGREETVRFIGSDTPESRRTDGHTKKNEDDDPWWRWPATAPERGEGKGSPGQSPTAEQLYDWGEEAKAFTKALLEGKSVWLVRDPGVAREDVYGRQLRQVRTLEGLDVELHLIENGLAVPWRTTSIAIGDDGRAYSRMELLERAYRAARAKAGTEEARGLWYSFDLATWKAR